MLFQKPYALVLSGGGAKGSYQAGAWKAFRELGIRFNAVIGTSIGALNGALIVQGKFRTAVNLWNNMGLEKVIDLPPELLKDGKFTVTRENVDHLRQMRDNIIRHGGMDTGPLKKIIEEHMDEKRIRKAGIDFGMVAYEITGWRPREIFLKDIPEGMLADYLLATSALPGFKAAKVKEKQYVDGGLYDNIPFALAKKRGYRRIIIVDVSGIGVNRKPEVEGTETIYIKNSIDMGTILDFSQEFIQRYMYLGYLDTLKVFGRNSGIYYYYNRDNRRLKKLDALLESDRVFQEYRRHIEPENFRAGRETALERVRQLLPENLKKNISLGQALVEYGALANRIDRIRMYNYGKFLETLHEKCRKPDYHDIANVPEFRRSFITLFAGRARENALIPLKVLDVLLKAYFG